MEGLLGPVTWVCGKGGASKECGGDGGGGGGGVGDGRSGRSGEVERDVI